MYQESPLEKTTGLDVPQDGPVWKPSASASLRLIREHGTTLWKGYGGELLAWRDETEWRIAELFFAEMQVVGVAREAWAGANHDGGDWTWGNSGDLVPMEYGWHRDEPNLV